MSTTGSWIFGRTHMRHKTHGALIHCRLKFNEANYTIVNYYQHFPQGCHTGEGFCLLVGFASGLRELNPKWAKLFVFSDVVSVVSEDCAVFVDPLLSGDASGISGYLKVWQNVEVDFGSAYLPKISAKRGLISSNPSKQDWPPMPISSLDTRRSLCYASPCETPCRGRL